MHWSGCQDLNTLPCKQMHAPFLPNATGYLVVRCRLGCSALRDGHYNAVRVNARLMLTPQGGQKRYQPCAIAGSESMPSRRLPMLFRPRCRRAGKRRPSHARSGKKVKCFSRSKALRRKYRCGFQTEQDADSEVLHR